MNQNMILTKARSMAKKSKMRFKLACIIIKDDMVCGIGYNTPVPTTKLKGKGYRSVHAEINALKNATRNMEKRGIILPRGTYTAIVVRVRQSGKFGNAKPCERCMSHMRASGVKTVYYTNSRGDFEMMEMTK